MGAESRLPGASDRCERQFSSSKLLRTEAENKHLGFRDDIPRYQPLANSSSYIRGQDTAVPALMQVGCRSSTGTEDERRVNTRSLQAHLNQGWPFQAQGPVHSHVEVFDRYSNQQRYVPAFPPCLWLSAQSPLVPPDDVNL